MASLPLILERNVSGVGGQGKGGPPEISDAVASPTAVIPAKARTQYSRAILDHHGSGILGRRVEPGDDRVEGCKHLLLAMQTFSSASQTKFVSNKKGGP
jgi:hypothetical protein